jgi:hypothetical protein
METIFSMNTVQKDIGKLINMCLGKNNYRLSGF